MIYNKQGLVTKAVDYSSGETSYYYYTFDGSLESEYRTSSDGSLTHYIVTDSNGNTVEKTSVNGQTKTITTGTDKDGKSFVNNDGVTNETSTDDFGRTTQVRTVRSDGTLVFNTDYEYTNGKAENSTTNLVSKYSSHTAVTAFCHMIILMMQTVILPRLSKTVNSLTSMFMTALTSLKKNTTM